MMTVEILSDRYLTLWMSAPSNSGIEQAASDVMAALETASPYERVVEKWREADEAAKSAWAYGDTAAQTYFDQKITVYEQFFGEWSA